MLTDYHHTDNLCTSRECKVFFMCKKAELDHAYAVEKFVRLQNGFAQIGYDCDGAVKPLASVAPSGEVSMAVM